MKCYYLFVYVQFIHSFTTCMLIPHTTLPCTELAEAIASCNVAQVRILLEQYPKIYRNHIVYQNDNHVHLTSPLHFAAGIANNDAVVQLIACHAQTHATSNYSLNNTFSSLCFKHTPLGIAIAQGNGTIVHYLVQYTPSSLCFVRDDYEIDLNKQPVADLLYPTGLCCAIDHNQYTLFDFLYAKSNPTPQMLEEYQHYVMANSSSLPVILFFVQKNITSSMNALDSFIANPSFARLVLPIINHYKHRVTKESLMAIAHKLLNSSAISPEQKSTIWNEIQQ